MKINTEQTINDMANLLQGGVPHEDDFLFFKKLTPSKQSKIFIDVGGKFWSIRHFFSHELPRWTSDFLRTQYAIPTSSQ